MNEIVYVSIGALATYYLMWFWNKIKTSKVSNEIKSEFFNQPIAGTGGMTLGELLEHREKSLATVCEACGHPHSLRMVSEETLRCSECGHEQPTWSDNHGN